MGPEEAIRMIREMEHLCYEDKLRELGLILDRRQLLADLAAFHYIKRAFKNDGNKLFSRACNDMTRRNSFN